MTRDGIMREGIGVVAMVVMAVHIVEETPHMLTQGIIEDQEPVSLRTAYLLGLLEEIDEPTVIDAVLEPRRFREEAGEVGFVSTLEHTAGDVRQAFVVQDDQTCQVILEMLKLAPILEEVPEDICMSGHQKRREAPAFMPGMDRRWARRAQCPRAQQDLRSTRALNGRGHCIGGCPGALRAPADDHRRSGYATVAPPLCS